MGARIWSERGNVVRHEDGGVPVRAMGMRGGGDLPLAPHWLA